MGLFLKKQRVFISHKRVDGGVSAEAVLLKRLLDKKLYLDNFMDVQKETFDKMPENINDQIRKSNSFIFLIPFNGDVSFLKNPDCKAYQEISDALFKYKIMPVKSGRKSFQILPVTFSKSFEWPDDLPQEISKITQFDICQLNLNNQIGVVKNKISKALRNKTHRSINWWGGFYFTILLSLSIIICVKHFKYNIEDSINDKRISFIKNSFENIITNRIEPTLMILPEERTSLEDSIYRFFEQRDQFYYIVQTLPEIKKSGIEMNDEFTANAISMVCYEYASALTHINELTRFSNGLNMYKDENMSIYNLSIQCQEKFDKLINNINSGHRKGHVLKHFNAAIHITHNSDFWEIVNREIKLLEETAKKCNLILDNR